MNDAIKFFLVVQHMLKPVAYSTIARDLPCSMDIVMHTYSLLR